jgi:hypothetical protein
MLTQFTQRGIGLLQHRLLQLRPDSIQLRRVATAGLPRCIAPCLVTKTEDLVDPTATHAILLGHLYRLEASIHIGHHTCS